MKQVTVVVNHILVISDFIEVELPEGLDLNTLTVQDILEDYHPLGGDWYEALGSHGDAELDQIQITEPAKEYVIGYDND